MTDEVGIPRDPIRLVIGLAIILVGVIFTLDNLDLIRAGAYFKYWPVLLVAVGVVKIVQTSSWVSYAWSLVWIVVGLWLLGQNVGLITISIWSLWPLLLVLLGATILWRAFWPQPACCSPQVRVSVDPVGGKTSSGGPAPARDSYVKAVAVMAGLERASDSDDFRGADLVAIMGGCELDLRQATIAGDQAVIDVMAFMGGIEIYVPKSWAIEAKVLPLMGGVGDETRLDKSGPTKRLVIRGLALMGGVEIKN